MKLFWVRIIRDLGFTQKGLTGDSEGYKDAYGLTKVLRMVEKSKKDGKDFYILTFTLEDYEKMLQGITFFEIIKEIGRASCRERV